ncbi:hypothetical protein QBZ16_002688 [Prototheca wickerhamii]|uniref:Uncharacterized protein n=1 Tax=Prototheca wickerhamii TaxID=3111 RepID=A0AAD9IIM3_PROWI|nr:hypothetical protein QBZ16_002688 [Prototheca wickerhamii]
MQASQPSASWSEPSFNGPDPALQLETLVASLRSSSAQAQALRARLLSSEMERLTLQRVLQAVRAEHKAQLSIAAAAAQASQTSAAMRARTIEELRWYVDHRRTSARLASICAGSASAVAESRKTASALSTSSALVGELQGMFQSLQQKFEAERRESDRLRAELRQAMLASEAQSAAAEADRATLRSQLESAQAELEVLRAERARAEPTTASPGGAMHSPATRASQRHDEAQAATPMLECPQESCSEDNTSDEDELSASDSDSEETVSLPAASPAGRSEGPAPSATRRTPLSRHAWLESEESDAWGPSDDDSDNASIDMLPSASRQLPALSAPSGRLSAHRGGTPLSLRLPLGTASPGVEVALRDLAAAIAGLEGQLSSDPETLTLEGAFDAALML